MAAWILFNTILLLLILIDLRSTVSHKNAWKWCVGWITLALLFAVGIFLQQGLDPFLQFTAAYAMELSLSIDNLFVFYLIFQHFHTPRDLQPKILLWGILGALAMRLTFILVGLSLIEMFHWLLPLFGLFLVVMGAVLFRKKESTFKPPAFLKKLRVSPFFMTLIAVEVTDLLFAIDSIPAVFGITLDPFLAYTSNAFAILGLRSFYFALQGALLQFSHLHYAISAILIFVGCKMVASMYIEVPIAVTFGVIAVVLGAALLESKKRKS